MWRKLRLLELDEVEDLEQNRLLEILKACPTLHTLAVRNFPFKQHRPPGSSNEPPISLLSLTSLTLESIPKDMLVFLVTRIQCPVLEALRLSAPEMEADTERPDVQPMVSFIVDFLQRITSGKPNPTVILGTDDFRVSTSNLKPPQLVIGLEGLEGLADEVCGSPTFHITTVVLDTHGTPYGWWSLRSRHDITTLHAVSCDPTCDLARYNNFDEGTLRWPFPDLQTLVFHSDVCDEGGRDILHMVRGRAGCYGTDHLGDVTIQLPAALQKVILPSEYRMAPEILTRINMILGEGKVMWEAALGSEGM